MVCVLVTCGGWGDVWLLDSREQAWLHPLHQYGDAILERPEDVCDQYNALEWSALRRKVGFENFDMNSQTARHQRMVMESHSSTILAALVRLAQPAPTDPAEICRRIVEDRRRVGTVAKKKADAPAMPAAEAKPAREKGSNLPPVARGPKGVALDATIAFGVDKEGNSYGAHVNNPKKEGSKTRARFAEYREGMTVQQALDAGITTADLVYDSKHGFVCFSSGSGSGLVETAPGVYHTAEDEGGDGDGESWDESWDEGREEAAD